MDRAQAWQSGPVNVVLTGFMGTGKSTVGRVLADRLGYTFVDTDTLIEQHHGSIPEIFAGEGEAAFRSYEAQVAETLAEGTRQVIATGGRLMLDPDNAAVLGATGEVFALNASADEVLRRVLGDDTAVRPLLAGDDPAGRVRALLTERAPLYAQFTIIETGGRSPADIAEEIMTLLEVGDAND